MDENQPQTACKDRKSRAGLSLKHINLDKKYKQLINIFDREINHLLIQSRKELVGKLGISSLRDLLELYKDFKQLEKEYIDGLSIEELEKHIEERNKVTEENE